VRLTIIIITAIFVAYCNATTHYVVPPGTAGVTPADPYTNWSIAGTNIIDVVNAAATSPAPRVVCVTNGTYYPTNQIYSTTAIALQSVNGRDKTVLDGMARTNNRCVQVLNNVAGAIFDGFTLTNYNYTADYGLVLGIQNVKNCLFADNSLKGGSVYSSGIRSLSVTNCIFRNNAGQSAPGIFANAPTPSVLITDCHFENNRAVYFFAGACDVRSSNNVISNCVFTNNRSILESGGAINFDTGTTNNLVVGCMFVNNKAEKFGGALRARGARTTIENCRISGNMVTNIGGGIWGTNMTIRNCLIVQNQALTNIGGGIWMTNSTIESCTIISNYAGIAGGGLYIDGLGSSGTNNIIYFNTAVNAANFTNTGGNTGLNYSCVIPVVGGMGNITNNPVLKDLAGGDYRLRMTSPCVNAGTNQLWMTNAVDLAGNARILKTIVDMGAYETRLWQGTIFKVP